MTKQKNKHQASKTYFFVAMFLLFAAFHPTHSSGQEIRGGIKAGLTLSNLYTEVSEVDDKNARFGFHGGFFSQILFLETFGLQPELLYTTKGTEYVYAGLMNQTVEFNMDYLEMPILAIFKPIDMLEFHAGPYFGLLLNSNVSYSGTIDGQSEIDRDNFNTFDYGFSAGIALNFGLLSTGIRYNVGLQKLAKTDAAKLLLEDSKNAYGQLYFALRLN